jgi:hypothetical protein
MELIGDLTLADIVGLLKESCAIQKFREVWKTNY